MDFVTRQIKRLGYALSGIRYAIRFDRSFRLQYYSIGLILVIALFVYSPLTSNEWLWLTLAYLLILITELQNSALEYALDHLHPDTHENIGRSKDMAAGSVLLAGLFLLIVLSTLAATRWW